MKTCSDFDVLLAGLSPEETRTLQKILAEWAHGDENGFPVQLALLTKAQWRTAAVVPKFVETERKLRAELLATTRSDTQATARSLQDTMRAQTLRLQSEVTRQSTAVREAAETIRVRLSEGEALARKVHRTLDDGERIWKEASQSFVNERKTLAETVAQACEQLENQCASNALLAIALALLIGITIGSFVTYRFVVRQARDAQGRKEDQFDGRYIPARSRGQSGPRT